METLTDTMADWLGLADGETLTVELASDASRREALRRGRSRWLGPVLSLLGFIVWAGAATGPRWAGLLVAWLLLLAGLLVSLLGGGLPWPAAVGPPQGRLVVDGQGLTVLRPGGQRELTWAEVSLGPPLAGGELWRLRVGGEELCLPYETDAERLLAALRRLADERATMSPRGLSRERLAAADERGLSVGERGR